MTDSIEESDIVFSVVYDKIFTESFLVNRRCYNFHYGILPDYGGVGSATWVIINGEKEHGVTLHEITPGLDQGPIIFLEKFDVGDNDTALFLYEKCENILYQMFKKYFVKIVTNDYTSQPQSKKPTIYRRRKLDKAKDITTLMRAFYFPGKESVYFYNKTGNKISISYDDKE